MDNSEIVKRFGKKTLLGMCEELGVEVRSSVRAADLVDIIDDDLDENGVPEEMSEELEDLAFVLGYIDEDGNLIEPDDTEGEKEQEEVIDGELPDCYGYADGQDPACKKCKIFDLCMAERIALRPACFGTMYDNNSPECHGCIEAMECKRHMEDS